MAAKEPPGKSPEDNKSKEKNMGAENAVPSVQGGRPRVSEMIQVFDKNQVMLNY